ncbi:MAG: hypothetical protein HN778_10595 [Prolixibacteraceae bacterium]|jgi:hypothetical protein|nr:hypothetical protein [Prolixibacteraceae bacterium]MBT6005897.1 hypothetical protein [Prolixibacteraceae bacterium]MBT6766093.1 hypothetical protein [Prolixibacteraceae bacterium]MBT6996847.1 hypothetical protein [Prolixibacteraceae bacterium]MBT7395270.1 hypothetical protein [Prolixibacteraceae bacterium]
MEKRILIILFLVVNFAFSCSKDTDLPDNDLILEDPAEKHETWTGLQIVMFTPSNIELPADYKERMKEAINYTEWFFKKWLNHWGYSCEDPLKIKRDEDGYPILWRVKGEHTAASGEYNELGYASKEVIPKAIDQFGISEENQTWCIISYPGPPSQAFRGGGNFRGGTSSANFTSNTGELIKPGDVNLATGAAAEFKLKAIIHELTHALGIAHIGPLTNDNFGNSLMGPTNNAYHGKYPDDNRVYLTKASAAILWKHPLFEGNFNEVNTTPSVQIANFQASFDSEKNTIQISGKLSSESSAHSVIAVNESNADKSEYWRKTFTGDVAEDGTFNCEISELSESSGKLIITFCFNNGAISGVSGKFGITKGVVKSYQFKNDTYSFN